MVYSRLRFLDTTEDNPSQDGAVCSNNTMNVKLDGGILVVAAGKKLQFNEARNDVVVFS